MEIINGYEELVKKGYIETGTFVIKVDDITKLNLSQEEVKNSFASQKEREDKAVVVVDKYGRAKKVSSIMFGYNKKNIKLADGSFANSEELLEAIKREINSQNKGTIIVNKKGKVLDPEQLLKLVAEAKGKVMIGEKAPQITNQDSRYWSIQGAKNTTEYKKGVVFLGNNGIDLNSGDYISVSELMTALNEYMIMEPKSKEETNVQKEKQESLIYRVKRKYKNKLSKWLVILASLAILLSGIKTMNNTKLVDLPENEEKQIVQMIEADQLFYNFYQLDVDYTEQMIKEAQKRVISSLKMGDEVQLEDGDTLYENSYLQGKETVIGKGLRQAGNYQVSGVSIISDGKIINKKVDLSIENPGFEIGAFINDVITENNLEEEKTDIRVHIGNNENLTRTGWIDISDLIKVDLEDEQTMENAIQQASSYNGVFNNFQGTTINIETINGPVTLNVLDSNGNLLQSGSKVIGSDGKEYIINNLHLSHTSEYQTSKDGSLASSNQLNSINNLSWSIQDCSLAIGLAPLLGAIAASIANKKKNEKSEENAKFFEFSNEEELNKFKKEFEEAKVKYENSSKFEKIKKTFFQEKVDVIQQLTEEQKNEIYNIIKTKYHNSTSEIEFPNGRVIITTYDGKKIDITNEIMPYISTIGKENKEIAEGLLKEDLNEFHGR